MIDIKVEVSGDAAKKLIHSSLTIARETDRAILMAAIMLEGVVKQKISRGGRGGRVYSVSGKRSQRSAPGEPPKTDTGRLVGSIRHEHSFLSASVGSEVNYAGYLELGTSRMAARPYLQPSFDENENKIMEMVENALKKAME
jgi:HK97 gp10 family phage protein